jgi:hypothetical protein
MIGVAQNNSRVEFGSFQRFEPNSLHRARSTDRHKDGSLDYPSPSFQNSCAGSVFMGSSFE